MLTVSRRPALRVVESLCREDYLMDRTLRIAPVVALLAFPGLVCAQADDFDDQESLEKFDIGFDGRSSGYFVQATGMFVDLRDQDASPGDGTFGAGGDGDISFSDGLGLSLAFGYEFETAPFQVSVEYSFRNNDIDQITGGGFGGGDVLDADGTVKTHALMFNALFDLEFTGTPFSWYAGGGIGIAFSEADLDAVSGVDIIADSSGDDSSFAYQLMTGLEYQIDENFTIFGGFRFFDAGSNSFEFAEFEIDSLNYELGLRYYF